MIGEIMIVHYYVNDIQATRNRTLKEMRNLYSRLEAGEESEAPGMLELWLREGKLTEEEIILEAGQIFVAGVDTVSAWRPGAKRTKLR